SLITVLAAVPAALWLAESRGLLPRYVRLLSYTDDASGLPLGSKVRLNGIPLGYPDHERLTGPREPKRCVEVDMKEKPPYLEKIPVDSVVRVVTDNLLSDKVIDITRGKSPEHVVAGSELRSVQAIDPNRFLADMGNDLQSLQNVVDHVNRILDKVAKGEGSL